MRLSVRFSTTTMMSWRPTRALSDAGRGRCRRIANQISDRRFRRGSAARSCCGISTASGPAGATSPPRPVKCTMSGTRPTAARHPSRISCCSAFPPPGCHPPVGLDPGPEPGRHHHGVEQGPDQGPAQPRTARPGPGNTRVGPGRSFTSADGPVSLASGCRC